MKNFIHNLGELKFLVGIYFLAFIIFSTVGSFFFNGTKTFDVITIWQILGMSAVFSVLHYIQTSKMKPLLKISVHAILAYLTVIVFSLLCSWGFAQSASVFWQFTLIFVVIYALIFIVFVFYYKNEEAYLNKKLEEYKTNK